MKNRGGVAFLAGCLCISAMSPGVRAQNAGTAPAGSVGAQTTNAASNVAPGYEQLRKSFKVDARVSLAMVRADTASHAGRVIEVRGTVSGLMSTAAGRTAIMQAEGATLVFALPPNLKDADVLRAGANVRTLLVVGLDEKARRVTFTPAAIALDPQPPQPAVLVMSGGGAPVGGVSVGGTPIAGASIVPPMTTMRPMPSASGRWTPPQPPPAQPPAIVAVRPGIDPGTVDDDSIEAQLPAYIKLARRFNKKLSAAQAHEIAAAILQAGYANGMDPRFLAAIIAVESDFNIYCLSSSGAMGLGQLMPFNLKEAGIRDAWNPTQNVWGTARLLRGHLNDYRSRPDGTLLAVAAYNAGPGAVRRAGYRVPPGAQVQRYVRKVYNRYKEFAPDMFR